MNTDSFAPDDSVPIRQAARQPCALMIVGEISSLDPYELLLAEQGFALVSVNTAAAALARQQLDPCSIILIAARLADASGAQLIEAVRAASNSAYVYVILQTEERDSVRPDADDWISTTAPAERIMSALNAARRVVTLERISRLGHEGSRTRALIDQVSGSYSKPFFLREAMRCIEQLRSSHQSVALLTVRVQSHDFADSVLAGIVNSLYDAVSDGSDVVTRLAPDNFAVLLTNTDAGAATLTLERIREQLAATRSRSRDPQAWPEIACAIVSAHGPVDDPQATLCQLLAQADAAPRTKISIARSPQDSSPQDSADTSVLAAPVSRVGGR